LNITMSERLLTPDDVADRCRISAKTVLRAIHRGQLRASRLGTQRAYRMREADVEEWIERSVLAPPPARRAPDVPAARTSESGAIGRLVLTPDMGRH
jgi:excisionase family DNA binding protein